MHTLTLTTSLQLRPNHIYDFRGAFISLGQTSGLKDEEVSLLANRKYADGNWGEHITAYPKIHYRVQDKHAVIWAVNEGVEVLQKMMNAGSLAHFTIQDVAMPLEPQGWPVLGNHQVQTVKDARYGYMVRHYVPYDHRSDHEYHAAKTFKDKINILERTLTGGIEVSLGELSPDRNPKYKIKVYIDDIIEKTTALFRTKNDEGHKITNHTRQYTLLVRTNVALPGGFAVGRMKAYGYGVMHPVVKHVL